MNFTKIRHASFSKAGLVYLPRKWMDHAGLKPGMKVEVSYRKPEIHIRKAPEQTVENVLHISYERSVLIPKEVRMLAKIRSGQEYALYIDDNRQKFIIQPIAQRKNLEQQSYAR